VSARTIRNVRNRSTWVEATLPHWTLRQRDAFVAGGGWAALDAGSATLNAATAVEIFEARGATAASLAAKVSVPPAQVS
jgi:hypothetical protein